MAWVSQHTVQWSSFRREVLQEVWRCANRELKQISYSTLTQSIHTYKHDTRGESKSTLMFCLLEKSHI